MRCGLSEATLRDVSRPRRWMGLSADDGTLLATWLERMETKPTELHTHVPIGWDRPTFPDEPDPCVRRMADSIYPRRIDAVLVFGGDHVLVECKPGADHFALGQVLCYAFWWESEAALPALSRVVVLTDLTDSYVKRAFFAYGVEVVELGEVLSLSRRGRRRLLSVDPQRLLGDALFDAG